MNKKIKILNWILNHLRERERETQERVACSFFSSIFFSFSFSFFGRTWEERVLAGRSVVGDGSEQRASNGGEVRDGQ